jgi:FtsH-binding integral membrane protein
VNHPVITIEDPSGVPGRNRPSWLQGRRLMIAAGIAVAEVVIYLLLDPSRWLGILIVGAILAACIAVSGRMRPGVGRDLVLVAGLAQAMVIALPVLVGFVTLVLAAVVVLLVIAAFVVIGLRFRR